jgi:TATA-box binding protein (TBP) (component of TFIID and TFIIIB)
MPPKKKRRLNPPAGAQAPPPRVCVYCAPTVSNCVSTAYIDAKIDLKAVAASYGRRAENVFPCCTISTRDPDVTFQVFGTGKLVISGAKSFGESLLGAWKFCQMATKYHGRRIVLREFAEDNLVAFGALGFPLDLPRFYEDHKGNIECPENLKGVEVPCRKAGDISRKRKLMRGTTTVEYDPERFRGLHFYPKNPLNVNLFGSQGSYIATGSSDPELIMKAIHCVKWSKYKWKPGAKPPAFDTRLARQLRKMPLFSDVLYQAAGAAATSDPGQR